MRTFDPPQCPHCSEYIETEFEYQEAIVASGSEDDPITLECPSCGEQFDVMEEDVVGESDFE